MSDNELEKFTNWHRLNDGYIFVKPTEPSKINPIGFIQDIEEHA